MVTVPGLDHAGVRPVAAEERFLPDDRAGADGQQVGAHRNVPGEDHHTPPDLRPQQPQIERYSGDPAKNRTNGFARTSVLTIQNRT